MALGIVKIYLGSPFPPISVVHGQLVRGQLVHSQFVTVSCRGPDPDTVTCRKTIFNQLSIFFFLFRIIVSRLVID